MKVLHRVQSLVYDEIAKACDNKLGTHDVPCLVCGPSHEKKGTDKREVLRIYFNQPEFIRYNCVRCGIKGYASAGKAVPIDTAKLDALKRKADRREREERLRRLGKAKAIWRASQPIQGTLGDRYLRKVRGIYCPLPVTLRFLAASRSDHHAAMVAAYGLPFEPEPGRLEIAEADIKAVQLTLLSPDGTKAKNAAGLSKISIGPSLALPIVVAPPNGLALSICEGVEDALSAHEATGAGAWASTGAKKMAALAPAIPQFIESLSILVDDDDDGRAGAKALATALRDRDCEVRLILPDRRAAK